METKKCPRCGVTKPYSEFNRGGNKGGTSSYCKECVPGYNREKYERDKEAHKAAAREHYRKNKKKRLAYQKQWQRENRRRVKDGQLQRQYGITIDEYERLLEEQGGGCAICGRKDSGRRNHMFAVDHCHSTGQVRGLLCQFCNRGLGFLGDDVKSLERALEYLKDR